MGFNERTIGGGSAKGLGEEFTKFLNQMITTGSFGGGTSGQQAGKANPMGDSAGIFGLLNSLISNPQADQSVQTLISKDIERGRNDLRAKFGAGGGMGYGTPAAVAEGVYQAEQAPRTAQAMDEMGINRLAALMPLFGMTRDIAGKGISQAETVMEPAPWMQGLNIAMDVANTAAKFIPGGGGGDSNSRNSGITPVGRGASPINDRSKLNALDRWAENFKPMPVPVSRGQQYYQ